MNKIVFSCQDSQLRFVINDLVEDGYSVVQNALAPTTIEQLKLFAQAGRAAGKFKPATIGKNQHHHRDDQVRGDHSWWIDDWAAQPALEEMRVVVATIMADAHRELYLPTQRFEGHFAVYPPGTGYRAHLDQHAGSRDRHISVVLYLSDLEPNDGGELKIHNTLKQPAANLIITPRSGTLVAFLSAKILHEVLATHKERWSLSGWIRNAEEGFTR